MSIQYVPMDHVTFYALGFWCIEVGCVLNKCHIAWSDNTVQNNTMWGIDADLLIFLTNG